MSKPSYVYLLVSTKNATYVGATVPIKISLLEILYYFKYRNLNMFL